MHCTPFETYVAYTDWLTYSGICIVCMYSTQHILIHSVLWMLHILYVICLNMVYSDSEREKATHRYTKGERGSGKNRKKKKIIWKMNGTMHCCMTTTFKIICRFCTHCLRLTFARHSIFFILLFRFFGLLLLLLLLLLLIHHECKWICIIHFEEHAHQPSTIPFITILLAFDPPFEA